MVNFKSLSKLLRSNPTEQDCINYLEEIIWNGKVISPFDPTSKVYKCKGNKYKCKNTGKNFTAKSLTVFRNSNVSMLDWFWALCYFLSKKGVSSCQLTRYIGTTQKSSSFVLHRLRKICESPIFKIMLGNTVEIDETFIGGKNKNRHWNKKVPHSQGRSWKDKSPVLVMVERGGNLVAQVVQNVKKETLEPIIRANVKEGGIVNTDEWLAYNDLKKWYKHEMVNHGKGQYVNGEAYVNTAESFNNFLKGTLKGTYHNNISDKHLQKYLDEIVFRYNTRKWNEKDRFDLLLSSAIGKCLTYKQLTSPF